MKKQFYFESQYAEVCYTGEYWMDYMKLNEITEIEVIQAVPDKAQGVFWCNIEAFCGDDSSETRYRNKKLQRGYCR